MTLSFTSEMEMFDKNHLGKKKDQEQNNRYVGRISVAVECYIE